MQSIDVKRGHAKLLADFQALDAALGQLGGDPALGSLLSAIDRELTIVREIVFGSPADPFPQPGEADLARAREAIAAGNEIVPKARARVAAITTERAVEAAAKREAWMDGVAANMTPDALVKTIEADARYQLSVDAAGSLQVAPMGLPEHLLHALRHHLDPVKAIIKSRQSFTVIG